jgi:hypothetical protein
MKRLSRTLPQTAPMGKSSSQYRTTVLFDFIGPQARAQSAARRPWDWDPIGQFVAKNPITASTSRRAR